MDFSWRFDLWFARLTPSPKNEGCVEGLVVRPSGAPHGTRVRPEEVELSPEEGVVGDSWRTHPDHSANNQVSLINIHVLDSLAGSDPERRALSGDNLQVDLDLSEENLPVGTRLSIGEAMLEISPKPHRPCRHFVARFGATAAKKVARAGRLGRRGRGVLCRVVEGGRIRVGDKIRVERVTALR